MDQRLYRQSVHWHGDELDTLVLEEQGTSPIGSKEIPQGVQEQQVELVGSTESPGGRFGEKLRRFIARKADLFYKDFDVNVPAVVPWEEDSSALYAIMPPLEQFMTVDLSANRRRRAYQLLQPDDLVLGRVVDIRDFGMFLRVLCLFGNKVRQFDAQEMVALCPISEMPTLSSHDNPLLSFKVNDLVKCRVVKVEADEEKILLSLFVPEDWPDTVDLGIVTDELPVHFERSMSLEEKNETYDQMIHDVVGFSNPHCVNFLTNLLGLEENNPPSLLRALNSVKYPDVDYAESLRQQQSQKWSLHNTAKGVDLFKEGQYVEAMQYFNHALQLDKHNTEALVARGALYAKKDNIDKAITDFEDALKVNPTHRNARKYLCLTLMVKAKECEDQRDIEQAINLYERVLVTDSNMVDAETNLRRLRKQKEDDIIKQTKASESKEQKVLDEEKSLMEVSRETLKQLLKADKEKKREKKKKKKEKTKKHKYERSSSITDGHKRDKDKRRSKSEELNKSLSKQDEDSSERERERRKKRERTSPERSKKRRESDEVSVIFVKERRSSRSSTSQEGMGKRERGHKKRRESYRSSFSGSDVEESAERKGTGRATKQKDNKEKRRSIRSPSSSSDNESDENERSYRRRKHSGEGPIPDSHSNSKGDTRKRRKSEEEGLHSQPQDKSKETKEMAGYDRQGHQLKSESFERRAQAREVSSERRDSSVRDRFSKKSQKRDRGEISEESEEAQSGKHKLRDRSPRRHDDKQVPKPLDEYHGKDSGETGDVSRERYIVKGQYGDRSSSEQHKKSGKTETKHKREKSYDSNIEHYQDRSAGSREHGDESGRRHGRHSLDKSDGLYRDSSSRKQDSDRSSDSRHRHQSGKSRHPSQSSSEDDERRDRSPRSGHRSENPHRHRSSSSSEDTYKDKSPGTRDSSRGSDRRTRRQSRVRSEDGYRERSPDQSSRRSEHKRRRSREGQYRDGSPGRQEYSVKSEEKRQYRSSKDRRRSRDSHEKDYGDRSTGRRDHSSRSGSRRRSKGSRRSYSSSDEEYRERSPVRRDVSGRNERGHKRKRWNSSPQEPEYGDGIGGKRRRKSEGELTRASQTSRGKSRDSDSRSHHSSESTHRKRSQSESVGDYSDGYSRPNDCKDQGRSPGQSTGGYQREDRSPNRERSFERALQAKRDYDRERDLSGKRNDESVREKHSTGEKKTAGDVSFNERLEQFASHKMSSSASYDEQRQESSARNEDAHCTSLSSSWIKIAEEYASDSSGVNT